MGELQGAVLVRNKCHVFNFGWDRGQFKLKKEQRNILTQFSPIAGTDFIQSGSFGLLVLSWIFLRKKIFLHILSFTPSNRRHETFISAASVDSKHWEWATSSLPFKAPFWHHRVRELSTCSSLIPFSLQVQRSSCNSGFCSSLSGLLLSHLIIYWNLHSYIFYICAALFAAKAIFCVKMIDWILRQIQRQKRILRAMQKDEGNLRWGLSKTVVWRFLSRTDWVQSSGAESFKS